MNTTTTIVGELVTVDGLAQQRYLHQPELRMVGPLSYVKPPLELRTRSFRVDALAIRSVQRSFVAVNRDHGDGSTLGHAEHFELRQDGSLWTVLTAYGPLPEAPLFLSPEIRTREDGSDLQINGIALTEHPAQICMKPVLAFPGGFDRHRDWRVPEFLRDMVTRARDAARSRRYDDPITVYDVDLDRDERRNQGEFREHLRQRGRGEMHYGPPGKVLRVY